ncbi:MAG: hypothetical protein GX535_02795 [Xanthomonadaceae bacterium]|nr:hypothetical protein [Xanthomonadaceae bacterium]
MDTVLKAASAEATLDAAPADLQPNTQAVVRPVHTLVECDHSTIKFVAGSGFHCARCLLDVSDLD